MVLTLKAYKPLSRVSDITPGGINHPAGKGEIRFACRVLTRYGQVVIDFDDFSDLISYNDSLGVEGGSGNFTIRMKANLCNEELLKRIHPGYVIEAYAARNENPLIGVMTDPSKIRRVDTTPDLSVIPSTAVVAPETTSPSGNIANGTLGSIEQVFEGGTNSYLARVIGYSEGNRTLEGGFSQSYGGHTDPGNSAHNVGSFSVQGRGRLTPEQADANQLQELRSQMPRYQEAARAAGLNPNDLRLLTNFTDLHTQSPRAARNFLRRLPELRGNTGTDAIVNLRVASFEGRSTLGSRLTADQRRRSTALDAGLARHGGAIAQTASTATPSQPAPATNTTSTAANVKTQQTQRYSTTLAGQRYAAPRIRSGGRRDRHAGVDLDISGNEATAISFIGGVCTYVGSNPCGYWDYSDIWNARLGVVERVAEYKTPFGVKVGDTVLPGQSLGKGEHLRQGSNCSYGVIHYEIRTSGLVDAGNGNKRGGSGFEGTTDPVNYLRSLGIDPYATPDKVFQNARIQPPAGGLPPAGSASGGVASASVQVIASEGAVVEAVEDYYLDKCPHLLLHGIITDYGRATDGSTTLTISGEDYGKIYRDSTLLLDINSPSTLGQAMGVRTQALVKVAVSLIYYQILRNWVESFWGSPTGWEARTRVIPVPPNYLTGITEGSAWAALQYLGIQGIFHTFIDHTGAICWEKLPWSGKDQSLIDGRTWETLQKIDLPSWKIKNWNDRLSEQGIANFLRIIPSQLGQDATGLAGMVYNMGSIRQYGGPTKREFQVPYAPGADQWYTSAPLRQSQADFQSFADLCVLEAIRWFDRPVQRCDVSVRGESAWRINTRVELTEDWHCADAKPGQYYVTSRSNSIDIESGSWTTSMSLVRDRRSRYLGIGVGEVPIILDKADQQAALDSKQFTGTVDPTTRRGSAPNLKGKTAIAEQNAIKVPLVPDEYYFFKRPSGVIPIGNDPIQWAKENIIAKQGQIETTVIEAPKTDTGARPPTLGGTARPATVKAPQLENDAPPGSYTLALERDGERVTEVPSPINGMVVQSTRIDDYGNVVEVCGNDGQSWFIAHLDARAVRPGQRVRRGQSLGNQGKTGYADNAHLHLEIRRSSRGLSQLVGDRTVTRPLVDEYLRFVEQGA